nr:RNA-directed DNA polymerase, eukaryota [Tanacetum cinerariifolium]
MGNYRTKEDDVAKISTSIFVTNFPESFSAKDLFQSCKQYGHVVDTFIPNKRSKGDKRFGFVQFINVFNDERASLKENNNRENEGGKHKTYNNAPTMVLDDACLFSKDVTNSLMGRVSENDEQSVEDVKRGDTVVHEVGNHGEDSDVDDVPETTFDESSGQKKKQSKDPFGIYPLLDKQRKVNSHSDTSNENVEKQNEDRDQNNNVEEPLNGRDDFSDNMGTKPDDLDSGCSGRFKKSVAPRTEGSILCLMEEVVKVGKTMRFGSSFNERGADMFNSFISNASLEEVPLGGCAYTWCHKSASKMSKLDREWINVFKNNSKAGLIRLKGELQAVDGDIDNGNGSDEVVSKRTEIINSMLRLNKIKAPESAQKAKIKWSVEGDENSKKRTDIRASIDMNFPKVLSSVQKEELECDVSKEELKRAVWDCGMDKSPGPDGFTFGFFSKFWSTIENDVYEAVTYFFTNGVIPKGYNSPFIALIPKTPGANMVKYFRPISLIGCINLSPSVNLSHMFYADDAVFIGHWNDNNINTLVNVLECFYPASGLRINMCKSKIMGVHVEGDLVKHAASKLGCLILNMITETKG